MPEASGLKIVACSLMVVLFGAVTTHAGFAEEAASSRDHAGELSPSAKSHRTSEERGTPGKTREGRPIVRRGVTGSIQPHRLPVPGAPVPVERNAIGLPVAHHEGIPGHYDEGHGIPAQIATPEVRGISAGGVGSFAQPKIAPLSQSPLVTTSAMNHGRINGTGLIRPTLNPSGIGGPAKARMGINGSAFRPKH
jgi:hypothetical protein